MSNQQGFPSAPATQPLVRARLLDISFLFLCALLLAVLHGTHQLDSDEGLILHGAWSILNGRVLYEDFFEFVAPGSFYLIAAAWKLFGAQYWVAKFIAIGAIAAAAAGVYQISRLVLAERQATASRWAILFGPFVLCLFSGYWPAINHNTFNIALIVWGSFFVCRSILRGNWFDAGIGGFICGIAILFLQHRGAILTATAALVLCVFYGRDKSAGAARNAVAFVLASVVPLAGLFLFWPASLLFENLIHFPATHYLQVNRVDPSLFLMVGTFLVVAAWLLREAPGRVGLFLMSLQAVMFLSALQRPDASHVTPILFPLLALFPLLVNAASGSRGTRFLVWWIAAGLVLVNVLVPIIVATRYSTPLFQKSQHPAIRYARENCTASPYIYAGPFVPGYYFETEKLNPTRHSFLLTQLSTDEHFSEVRRDIEAHRPQCILTNYEAAAKFKYDGTNVLDEYIRRTYEVTYQSGRVQVWMARSPSVADLKP